MSSQQQPTASPLRLLIIVPNNTRATSLIPPLLSALTGTPPPGDLPTFSGYTSHPPLRLRTRYYNANVNIWIDEVPLRAPAISTSTHNGDETENANSGPTLAQWKEQMLSAEAREVRQAIGGILLVLPNEVFTGTANTAEDVSRAELLEIIAVVGSVRDEIELDRGGDCAAGLVLQDCVSATAEAGMGGVDAVVEELEEELLDRGLLGWDVVPWDGVTASENPRTEAGGGRPSETVHGNAYGEKKGIDRVLEILEVVAWSASSAANDSTLDFLSASDEGEAHSDDGNDTLKPDEQELQREMLGLSLAVRQAEKDRQDEGIDEEDLRIESLPGLMERVVAVREKGSNMPRDEREKFAKKAIAEIMNEI